MATIVYSRNQYLPEVLYLPLSNGAFIQLQEGVHQYPDYAAYDLKTSDNPIINGYKSNGTITISLENSDVSLSQSSGAKFAPLDFSAINTKSFAPINQSQQIVSTNDSFVSESVVSGTDNEQHKDKQQSKKNRVIK